MWLLVVNNSLNFNNMTSRAAVLVATEKALYSTGHPGLFDELIRIKIFGLCNGIYIIIIIIIISGSAPQRGLWPPRSRGFVITHNGAPQSIGLLWTSDQLVAQTTWQHTTNIHAPGGIWTNDRSRRAALHRAATGTDIITIQCNVIQQTYFYVW
jgi:hypothetical protein